MRNNWLNPPDVVMRMPEVVEGYPDRILPKNEAAAQVLKQRTLTNLYNEQPAWLDNAHRNLDEAVAHAYGWKPDMSDDEILIKLLALNLERTETYLKRGAQLSREYCLGPSSAGEHHHENHASLKYSSAVC